MLRPVLCSIGLAIAALGAACGEKSIALEFEARASGARAAKAKLTRDEEEHTLWFVDATGDSGLGSFHQVNGTGWKDQIIEATGGGLALFDYDQDGDLDVYLTNGGEFHKTKESGEPVRDALYANDGHGIFTDVTAQARLGDANWTNGVSVVDYDADGWPDLFLANFGPNALLRNMGDGTFRNVSKEAHVRGGRWSMGSCFFDFDRDGDLDLYVSNYIGLKKKAMLANPKLMEYEGLDVFRGPRGMQPQADLFYINEGDGTFREASAEVGLDVEPGFGFQVALIDYNQDGWMDLYVANDSVPNYLWHNNGRGSFSNRALQVGLAVSSMGVEQAGMGIGVGDFDGDLRDDLFVTNFSLDYSTLYRGLSGGLFRDVTKAKKLVQPTFAEVSWGCGIQDFDNDGTNEVYLVSGHVYSNIGDKPDGSASYAQRNAIYQQRDGEFVVPEGAGGPGFAVNKVSRGSVVGDIDGDGDLDMIVSNIDDIPTVLRNEGHNDNHWVALDLVGSGKNLDAIGARVIVRAGRKEQARTQSFGDGFLSSSEAGLHFGLGQADVVDEVEITWPDGTVETYRDLPVDRSIKLHKSLN